ncbi:lipopolysaccharide biosynthesis protein [Palleniella muris]|uniref:Lipopolysaccharide biosynthesis protein n=1 Tax=Palleniella muris TaxID=3038145 RepID=A0AC61QPW0_9BACT|nr:oligosaccharide flippase family protein [Palleniella muris]TGX82112.1 lipopolysaccharide biosynthesis protein [Palleniella muris]
MNVSSDNKRLAKNTLILYMRMFLTMVVGFYTSRVVLNTLGIVDYGIYNVVGGIVGVLSMLNSAMAGTTQRWITMAIGVNDSQYLRKVFAVGLTAQCIIGLIVFILMESIGLWYLYTHAVIPVERIETAFWVFQISVFTLLLNIINVPFLGSIIAHEKMGVFASFSIVEVFAKLIICFMLSITLFDKLLVYAILLFLASMINFFWLHIYCQKKIPEARFIFGWDKQMYKEMWNLTSWTMVGHISLIGYTQGIVLLINMFFGPALNAAYSIANQATNIINQFSSSFQTAINPQITKNYASKQYGEMHKLIYRSAKFSYFLMLVIAVPLFFEANFLLRIWLGNVPDHSVAFMRWGIFIAMLTAVRNPLVTAAIANGHLKKYQLVVNGILIMVAPLLYIAFKLGASAEWANIILLIAMFLAVLASAFMLQKMVALNFGTFIKEVVCRIIIVSIFSFVIPLLLYTQMNEGWNRLFVLGLCSVIVSFMSIYFVGLTAQETRLVRELVSKKMNKIFVK